MNLLLSGPPGTGKTEFVKYFAQQLGRKLVVLSGSDLLSKYVGETEQRIRAAFDRAAAEKSILFLDEIDGMLQNRENAQRSWEVSRVNEILQRMESFGGIFVASTNFAENLDKACLRRFTFKVVFDYLDAQGAKCFFERMFRATLTEEETRRLACLRTLTPGDFRTVRQSLYYLGDEVGNEERLAALEEEVAAKRNGQGGLKAAVGF